MPAGCAGDYQGRIIIWGLFTGERKSWVTYRCVNYWTLPFVKRQLES
jgi:hypothetical protein